MKRRTLLAAAAASLIVPKAGHSAPLLLQSTTFVHGEHGWRIEGDGSLNCFIGDSRISNSGVTTLRLPPGEFRLSNPLVLPNGCQIRGDGNHISIQSL